MGGWIVDSANINMGRAKMFGTELGKLEDELLGRHRVSEDRFKEKQKRRKDEVAGRHLERRHRDMLQRVGATATLPKASQHLQQMRGGGRDQGGHRGGGGGGLSGDDAALLELFNTIREFADLPDCTPPKKIPSGLNGGLAATRTRGRHSPQPRPPAEGLTRGPRSHAGFQRAMVHQYCEELGVAEETRGQEPNRCIHLLKRGDGANESAAARFKRELGEAVKVAATMPEEEDKIRLGVPGWKARSHSIA